MPGIPWNMRTASAYSGPGEKFGTGGLATCSGEAADSGAPADTSSRESSLAIMLVSCWFGIIVVSSVNAAARSAAHEGLDLGAGDSVEVAFNRVSEATGGRGE